MIKIIRNNEGKRVVLDTTKDTILYAAPENPPNTGSKYTSGIDIYVHTTTKSKENFFYKKNWSMWQGVETTLEPFDDKEEAIEYLSDCVSDYWGWPDDADIELLKKYDIELLKEEA
jgi:hypothetical protein